MIPTHHAAALSQLNIPLVSCKASIPAANAMMAVGPIANAKVHLDNSPSPIQIPNHMLGPNLRKLSLSVSAATPHTVNAIRGTSVKKAPRRCKLVEAIGAQAAANNPMRLASRPPSWSPIAPAASKLLVDPDRLLAPFSAIARPRRKSPQTNSPCQGVSDETAVPTLRSAPSANRLAAIAGISGGYTTSSGQRIQS